MTSPPATESVVGRALRALRPSHQHSAYSATVLLIAAQMLSRIFGYLREAYIAKAFGASPLTDVYYAAFQIPDNLYYIVAGGAASITFVSIYSRYLAEKREEEGQRVFSVVLSVMTVALVVLIVLGEVFTRPLVQFWFPKFTLEQVELCVYLTRILLPMQLFFYVGGTMSAVLQTRRLFLLPALAPVVYTCGIIVGGITLSSRLGITSLALGAVAGAFVGPFLINALGAARVGMHYRPNFSLREQGFREWVRLSIPLMIGVSLATVDEWIMRYFASGDPGAITRLNYAKRLFAVPYGVLGLAIGVASMTFFARLFSENRLRDFGASINDAIYRTTAGSLLLSAWLVPAALPAFDLAMRRGKLTFADSRQTAVYFAIFSLSLAFWTAQALYARAFYATRNTLTPMLAASGITLASIPLFWALYRAQSITGLAIASDIGIVAQTVALALLLDRRKLARLSEMPWREMGKVALTAAFAGLVSAVVARAVPVTGTRMSDIESLALVTVTWGAAVALGLWATRSQLPQALRSRRAPAPAETAIRELPQG